MFDIFDTLFHTNIRRKTQTEFMKNSRLKFKNKHIQYIYQAFTLLTIIFSTVVFVPS